MQKAIDITLTREDITKGKLGDAHNCPVARAAKRAGFKNVRAGTIYLQGEVNGKPVFARMPRKATTFIRRFDDTTTKTERTKLKPFSFRIKL